MVTSIRIKTKSKIIVSSDEFLTAVNEMREAYGDEANNKRPIDIEEAMRSHRVMVDRDDNFGTIGISVRYKDGGTNCIRKYPGSGLDELSEGSSIELIDGAIEIVLNFTLSAGRSKWKKKEVDELGKIFYSGRFKISLELTLSRAIEWSGHSSSIRVSSLNDGLDIDGSLSSSCFFVDVD